MGRTIAFMVLWVGATAILVALYAATEALWEVWSEWRGPAMIADEFPHIRGWDDDELLRLLQEDE